MPIPTPYMGKNSESKKDFLKRCVSHDLFIDEMPDGMEIIDLNKISDEEISEINKMVELKYDTSI